MTDPVESHEEEHEHAHDPEGHEHDGHDHDGHDHDHDHDHDDHDHEHAHTLISDRLPAGNWVVDPEGSDVQFRTRALLGILPVSGVFEGFTGELHVDDHGVTSGNLTVRTETLDTGIAKRDEHLKTAEFLFAAEHPQMVFTVQSINPSGEDHLDLVGQLQIREKTIPLKFPMYAIAHGDHLHLEARATIDHHGAGFSWAKPLMIAKKVRAEVSVTLQRA